MRKISFFFFIISIGFSIWLYTLPTHDTIFNHLYNLAISTNFLIATISCFDLFKKCVVHRHIHLTLGIGSFLYFLAQIVWFIYNSVLQIEIPYPGIPDIFFIGFYLFVATGGIMIMKSNMNIKFNLSKMIEIIVITGMVFLIVNSFIQSAASPQESLTLLTKVLNYAYPALDALLIALTLTAIRSNIGSLQPKLLYFMFAFIFLTFADTLFSYSTTIGTQWNGNYVDALFAAAGYLFAMGIISLPEILHPELGTESLV